MKQKHTITVADMEMKIVSDASVDELQNIVGMLDRRMREINLKSPNCTKNEAAILCALSYCSERIAMQEAFKKVEKDAFRFAGENEKLKKDLEAARAELEELKKDNGVMRMLLDRTAAESAAQKPEGIGRAEAEPAREPVAPYVPKPFGRDPETEAKEEPETASPEAIPASAPVAEPSVEEKKGNKSAPNKSHIGGMFDLLTFNDV